jgi:hypothetical protein
MKGNNHEMGIYHIARQDHEDVQHKLKWIIVSTLTDRDQFEGSLTRDDAQSRSAAR